MVGGAVLEVATVHLGSDSPCYHAGTHIWEGTMTLRLVCEGECNPMLADIDRDVRTFRK